MITTNEIESALRPALPSQLYAQLPALARLLAALLNSDVSPAETQSRLVSNAAFAPLLQALAGRRLSIDDRTLAFTSGAPLVEAGTTAPPNANAAPDFNLAERGPQVVNNGGTINGPAVAVNNGEIKYYLLEIDASGTKLNDGKMTAVTVIEKVVRRPRPPQTFYDRTDPLRSLQGQLRPAGGAWLYGQPGCGVSMLLRQAANLQIPDALPNGVIYLNGTLGPDDRNEILRDLYVAFHRSESPIAVDPESAKTFLSERRALFVLDRLPLAHDELVDLADTLPESAVLIAAEGPPYDALADLPLEGLPREDAIRLCATVAQLDATQPESALRLGEICAMLADLPLPLLLVGRLLRANVAPLGQLAAVLGELIVRGMPAERAVGQPLDIGAAGKTAAQNPLEVATQLALQAVDADGRSILAALARAGRLDLATLTATSQLTASAVERALRRLIDLGLAAGGNERYQISSSSLRRVLDQLLPAGDERKRAALCFASVAQSHIGDVSWLQRERGNLLAAIKTLLHVGQAAEAGALAQALQPALVFGGHWSSWGQVIDLANQAAQASGDLPLQAWALHERGSRAGLLGDKATAARNLTRARRLRQRLGDRAGADVSLHNIRYLKLFGLPYLSNLRALTAILAFVVATAVWFATGPAAGADAATTVMGAAVAINVLANDRAIASQLDPISLSVTTPPAHGSAVPQGAEGAIRYMPLDGFSGDDTFSYRVCNSLRRCAIAGVSISVVNQPPAAADDSATSDKNTPVTIDVLANDRDPDGALDLSSVQIIATPGHGGAVVSGSAISYTPAHDFAGRDSFGYRVCDLHAACSQARVLVSVDNQLPIAGDDRAQTNQNEAVTIDALTNDRDPDGDLDPASVKIVGSASHGQSDADAGTGSIRYTPSRGFTGDDRLRYRVCDTTGSCVEANIIVAVVNRTPIAGDDRAQAGQNEAVTIDVLSNDNDPDDALNPASVVVVEGPNSGQATPDPQTGTIRYASATGFVGDDRFQYQVCDTHGGCARAAVVVTVINHPPEVRDDTAATPWNAATRVAVLENDSDPDGILDVASVAVIEAPTSGQSLVDPQIGAINYTPNPGPAREDRFRYQACDTQGSCAEAAVVVTITNQAPIVQGDSADIKRDQSGSINVLANDSDPEGALDPGSVEPLQAPQHGQATVQPDATISYLPAKGYIGADHFDYQVCDGQGLCAQAVVTVTVTPTAMIAINDHAETPSGEVVVIAVLANDQAPDSKIDPSSLKVVGNPTNGQTQVDARAGMIGYRPNSRCVGALAPVACGKTTFIGDDAFEYQVCNTEGECANAHVTITVTNRPPIIEDDAATTAENTPVSIPIFDNDSDPEDELDLGALQISTLPSHGTLSADPNQNGMLYTPNKGYIGDDSFVYQLCDRHKDCDTANVTIQVQQVQKQNLPPIAQDDTATLESGGEIPIHVLDNDSDPDGKLMPSSLTIIKAPANGTVTIYPDGTVLYTPNQGFVGVDRFVYTVADDQGAQDSATVTINVTPPIIP